MTRRQNDAFEFIKKYIAKNGFSPTYDEISAHIEMSKSRVSVIIADLIQQNRLRHIKPMGGAARNLEPVIHNCPHCKKAL